MVIGSDGLGWDSFGRWGGGGALVGDVVGGVYGMSDMSAGVVREGTGGSELIGVGMGVGPW